MLSLYDNVRLHAIEGLALLGRGGRVAFVPRLWLRQCFERVLLLTDVLTKHDVLAVAVIDMMNNTEQQEVIVHLLDCVRTRA